MIIKLSVFVLPFLIISINCQFAMDMPKPDMSFGDDNDRFDITSMMRKQNRLFREQPGEYRRQSRRDNDEEEDEQLKILEEAFNTIQSRLERGGRRNEAGNEAGNDANFAYHDEMYSKEGGGVTDFEINLKQFQRARPNDGDYRRVQKYIDRLHGGQSTKVGNPEREMLMHYAFPIDLKVKGYLQAPLVK